jgi:penicillin-binding protein 1C
MTRPTWTRTPRARRGLALLAALLAAAVWIRCGPLPPGMLDLDAHVSTEVVDRHGIALYEALSDRGLRNRRLDPAHLPENLVRATLAAEDARFFRHPGVDPVAIARALWRNTREQRMAEGGSTITQQTAKLLTHRRRTAAGKAREMLLALRLEHRLSKREILALYLSVAPYGNQLTGAEAASRAYFGCAAADLTPAQAALLAGLPWAPSMLDPYRHLPRAVARQRLVLDRMEQRGLLSAAEARRARAERLIIVPAVRAFTAPHFLERALQAAGEPAPRRIETTLDAALQDEVAGIVAMHRRRLEEHGARHVAVAVLDNVSGEWLAWEGSGDYEDDVNGGRIDGVIAPRQPGSALKPFTYALAFERGFSPATVLPDVPAHFPTAEPGILYSPRNYDGQFRGPLRARLALAGSENVPAVWTLSRVGVPDLLRLLRRAGLSTLDRTAGHYGFGLTMGDAEVRLDELVAAYSALARGGSWRAPRLVKRITRDAGVTEPRRSPDQPLVSPRAAFWVTDILSDPDARAWAFGAASSLDFAFPVAVKTGTSQAYRDNWTVGYTRAITVGVWVGNFDREPLRNSSGVTGAAPIFHDVLLAAERRVSGRLPAATDAPLAVPAPGLARRTICALSGREATSFCPRVETEWLPAGELPSCRWHRHDGGRTVVDWPPVYRAWARARGLVERPAVLRRSDGNAGVSRVAAERARAEAPLQIVNPPPGGTYLRDPTLPAAFQTLPLRAIGDGSASTLTWRVDGRPVGSSAPDAAIDWPLAIGAHTIAVTDDRGRTDETSILVK